MKNICENPDLLVNFREGLQTPAPFTGNADTWMDPHHNPPPFIDFDALNSFIPRLSGHPRVKAEFPNPSASPSMLQNLTLAVMTAEECGVTNQIAFHTRMTSNDVKAAMTIGSGFAMHLFGNTLKNINGGIKDVSGWLNSLNDISVMTYEGGLTGLRASLEQTTELDYQTIEAFANGLVNIRRGHRALLTSLGLPDTKGVAKPGYYSALIKKLSNILNGSGIQIYAHIHDDDSLAISKLQEMKEACQGAGIHLCIEATPDRFPGERTGLIIISQLLETENLHLPSIPDGWQQVIIGTPWFEGIGNKEVLKRSARLTDVAGIHQKHPDSYTNGESADQRFPAPGISPIGGKGPIIKCRTIMFPRQEIPSGIDSDLALIGRELAAQHGSLAQAWLRSLTSWGMSNPERAHNLANSFGEPTSWISRKMPDLQQTYDDLAELNLNTFGNSYETEFSRVRR